MDLLFVTAAIVYYLYECTFVYCLQLLLASLQKFHYNIHKSKYVMIMTSVVDLYTISFQNKFANFRSYE